MDGLGDPGLIVAGLDPGLSGALAVLDEEGDCETCHMPCMGDPRIMDGGAVARWLGDRCVQLAVIEQQQAFPKQGLSSSFRTGQSYGQLLGVLQACLIPYKIVTPARWKKDMNLSRDKEQSRRRAIELLPQYGYQFSLKKDEARAEAALIAWWYLHERREKDAPQEKNAEGAASYCQGARLRRSP